MQMRQVIFAYFWPPPVSINDTDEFNLVKKLNLYE